MKLFVIILYITYQYSIFLYSLQNYLSCFLHFRKTFVIISLKNLFLYNVYIPLTQKSQLNFEIILLCLLLYILTFLQEEPTILLIFHKFFTKWNLGRNMIAYALIHLPSLVKFVLKIAIILEIT
mgnify:CR=1 FL=1